MALNKEKITASALKYLQKGQIDKAAREYEKILEVDPTDEHALHKVGDLYLRMNRKQEALNMYNRVSELYVRQGFYLKAIAVYKQILNIDPQRLELHIKMAEMYNQLGLLSETVNQYQFVARRYEEEQRHIEALDILRQVTRLDPENLPNKIKLAEGLIKHGKAEEGIETYSAMMKDLERLKKEDEYLRVAERYLQHNPADNEVSCRLAAVYIERAEYKKSLHILQNTLRIDHNNLAALELFAEGFIKLKQFGKAVTVYKEMVQLLKRNRSERKKLEWVLERIISIDPEEHESHKLLAELQKRPDTKAQAAVKVPADEYSKPSVHVSHASESVPVEEKSGETAAKKSEQKASADIDRLLTEGEIFIKYGLIEKAAERLDAILEVKERDTSTLERIKNFCVALGKPEVAVHQMLLETPVLLDRGEIDQARTLLEKCLAFDIKVEKLRAAGIFINGGNVPELRRLAETFLTSDKSSSATDNVATDETFETEIELLEISSDKSDEDEFEELEALEELEELTEEETTAAEAPLPVDSENILSESGEIEIISYMDENEETKEETEFEDEVVSEDTYTEIELDELEGSALEESEDVLTVEKLTASTKLEEATLEDDQNVELELDYQTHNYRQESLEEEAALSSGEAAVETSEGQNRHFEEQRPGFRPAKPLVKEAIELLVSDADTPDEEKPEGIEDDDEAGFEVLDEIVVYKEKAVQLEEHSEDTSESLTEADINSYEEQQPEEYPEPELYKADEPTQLEYEDLGDEEYPDQKPTDTELEQSDNKSAEEYGFDIESAVEQEILQQAQDAALQQTLLVENSQLDSAIEETDELEILEDLPAPESEVEASTSSNEVNDEEAFEILEETVVDFDARLPESENISPMDSFELELFASLEKKTVPVSTSEESVIAEDPQINETSEDEAASTAEEELEETLEEAEFFLAQGLFEEAIEIYEELAEQFPDNKNIPALLAGAWELFDINTSTAADEKTVDDGIGSLADDLLKSDACDDNGNFEVLEEISARNVPPELPQIPRVIEGGPDEDDSVELAEEVFAEIEEGRELKLHSRKASSSDEALTDVDGIKTHYKLGVAYKEMGLLNEAIAEFNLASEGGMFFDANAMLGTCYIQKKMSQKALSYFKKLIRHPDMTRGRLMELRYDVARTLEESGDLETALRYYRRIRSTDPTFEDAAARTEAFEDQGIVVASEADEIERVLDEAEKIIPPDIDSFGRGGSSDGNIGYI